MIRQRSQKFRCALGALAIALAAGCGGSGSGGAGGSGNAGTGGGGVPGVASCTQTQTVSSGGQTLNMKICTEWTGVSAQQLEAYRLGCGEGALEGGVATQQRVFAAAPCGHEGALGGCRVTLAGVSQTGWYYDDDTGFTLATVQQVCGQAGGTFVAP